jgi:hypothetical protein
MQVLNQILEKFTQFGKFSDEEYENYKKSYENEFMLGIDEFSDKYCSSEMSDYNVAKHYIKYCDSFAVNLNHLYCCAITIYNEINF